MPMLANSKPSLREIRLMNGGRFLLFMVGLITGDIARDVAQAAPALERVAQNWSDTACGANSTVSKTSIVVSSVCRVVVVDFVVVVIVVVCCACARL